MSANPGPAGPDGAGRPDAGDNPADPPARRFLNLHESAYQSLRRALMSGAYGPGQKLSIRKIGASLGLSGTPVREAFKRLVAEGVLVMPPYRSVHVADLSEAEIRELWFIRMLLEGEAAFVATQRADSDFVDQLAAVELGLDRARETGAVDQVSALNAQFHFFLYSGSGMPRLCREIEQLWLSAAPQVRSFLLESRTSMPHGQRLHADILKALRRGEAATVRDLVRADIKLSLDRVLESRAAAAVPSGRKQSAAG